MQNFRLIIRAISIAVSFGIAMPVFAQSAPVYDADTMQQQFDNGVDQGQDLPPPPPPTEGAYVPIQQQPSPQTQQFAAIDNQQVSIPQQQQLQQQQPMTMDQRVRRMEQQLDNLANNNTNARIESLQDQIQSLRGQVEQLVHQLAQVQDQQKAMYADLDKRFTSPAASKPVKSNNAADDNIANEDSSPSVPVKTSHKPIVAKQRNSGKSPFDNVAETSKPEKPTQTAAQSDAQPNVAEEQQIYQTAYNLIKAKKYSEAVVALNSMLKKYPSGQFAANAHYWLGELYGLMAKNDLALNEFSAVVRTYPDSPRVSDAQLKVGLIYASQYKWMDAKSAFKKVINHYPGTASARLALEQLKQIKQAGH